MTRREFAALAALAPVLAAAKDSGPLSNAKPLLVLPETARVYNIAHGDARILVGKEQSAGQWWMGSFLSEAGRMTSLHVHHSADEQFYALEGTVSVWFDGKWHDLPPGGIAAVPRDTPHALGNRTQQPIRFLTSGNPAGFEGFFADIEKTAQRVPYGSPEFLTELKKIYTRYDSELLGPAPQS